MPLLSAHSTSQGDPQRLRRAESAQRVAGPCAPFWNSLSTVVSTVFFGQFQLSIPAHPSGYLASPVMLAKTKGIHLRRTQRASLEGLFIKEDTMKQFVLGVLLGSLATGTEVGAGSLYDSKGNVKAPSGSQQQFDYFRQRQQQIDIGHMRKQMEKQELDHQRGKNPC